MILCFRIQVWVSEGGVSSQLSALIHLQTHSQLSEGMVVVEDTSQLTMDVANDECFVGPRRSECWGAAFSIWAIVSLKKSLHLSLPCNPHMMKHIHKASRASS